MKLNMNRYRKLVEQKEKFQNQGKDFWKESQKEAKELMKYKSTLAEHFTYTQHENFYELLKNYMTQKITTNRFNDLFIEMWNKDRDDFHIFEKNVMLQYLSTFEANSDAKVEKFCYLIDDLFSWYENVGTENDFDIINDSDYRNEIRKIFVEMQNLFTK